MDQRCAREEQIRGDWPVRSVLANCHLQVYNSGHQMKETNIQALSRLRTMVYLNLGFMLMLAIVEYFMFRNGITGLCLLILSYGLYTIVATLSNVIRAEGKASS